MKTIHLQYFAVLRELAGRSHETVQTDAASAGQLYGELLDRYEFKLGQDDLRVVVNEAFGEWTTTLNDGDEIVFLPPVAGG